MTTSDIVWIVIAAAVALLLLGTLALVTLRVSNRRRHRRAEEIRDHARTETNRVERREALAEETAAKARAAQADAEVKAAEAARLKQRAAAHQSEAATSREDLDERWKHADDIDPMAKRRQEADGLADDRGEQSSEKAHYRAADAEDTQRKI